MLSDSASSRAETHATEPNTAIRWGAWLHCTRRTRGIRLAIDQCGGAWLGGEAGRPCTRGGADETRDALRVCALRGRAPGTPRPVHRCHWSPPLSAAFRLFRQLALRWLALEPMVVTVAAAWRKSEWYSGGGEGMLTVSETCLAALDHEARQT